MIDPAYAIQAGLVAVLKANATLQAAIGSRVWDTVPEDPTFPYVTLGEDFITNDSADEVDAAATVVTIHVWSKPPSKEGSGEMKRIAGIITEILDQSTPDLGDVHAVVSFDHLQTRYLRDPDGVTRHAVLSFNVLTDAVG